MTRTELIQLVVAQARSNGFEFRKWFVTRMGLPWAGAAAATEMLSEERRYYALLFSHEFACCFWKPGSAMTLQMPEQSFPRRGADGAILVVRRRGYLRRVVRENAWLFHLREMAANEEPLRYIRRFLRVEEDLEKEPEVERPIVIVDEEDLLPEED